jgi:predicted glutamine amidotransferase
MCRWLIYYGDIIKLHDILFDGHNSIIKQSYKKTFTPFLGEPNVRDHEINADGFGVGWFQNDMNDPCIYISTNTPWSDINIKRLSKYIDSKLIFTHIRAIKPLSISIVHEYNCHPFSHKNFMFMHNGDLKNFIDFKKKIINDISDDIYKIIKGNTDSEYAFGLFLNLLEEKFFLNGGFLEPNIFKSKIIELIKNLIKYGNNEPMSMNFAFTDGKTVVSTRFINSDEEPPSLYYRILNNNIIISSEPIDYDESWNYIEKNSIVTYSNNNINIEKIIL